MDIRKLVAIAWQDIQLPDQKSLKHLRTDGLREASEVQRITLPRRETIASDQIFGKDNELAIIVPKVLARHVGECGSVLDELLKVPDGVAALLVEMWIHLKNFVPEDIERNRDLAVLETSETLPRLTLRTGVATGPVDGSSEIEIRTASKLLNVIEKRGEAQGGETKFGSIFIIGHRHIESRGYSDGWVGGERWWMT